MMRHPAVLVELKPSFDAPKDEEFKTLSHVADCFHVAARGHDLHRPSSIHRQAINTKGASLNPPRASFRGGKARRRSLVVHRRR
jgi:hypothetical protein